MTRKDFASLLKPLVNAGFSGIWVHTYEADEAQADIHRLCSAEEWRLFTWDCVQGIGIPSNPDMPRDDKTRNPLAPLSLVTKPPAGEERNIILLHNYHRFLEDPRVMQALLNSLLRGKGWGVHYLVLSPVVEIPVELDRSFTVIEHPLPDPVQIKTIANELLEKPTGTPVGPEIITAALGLTRREAENAFSLSICETAKGIIAPDIVWELKIQSVAKEEIGKISLPKAGLSLVGGYNHYKELCTLATRPGNSITPKGDILVSPTGCGKTSLARALAADWGVPLIEADLAGMKGSKVGQSEDTIRRFIDLCEAIGQGLEGLDTGRQVAAVVLIDEIEKALAGATEDGGHDAGVSMDQLSTLLKWRQDSQAPIFVIGTCNNAEILTKMSNGALVREDRFDGLVFVDLPTAEEKEAIWNIQLKAFELKPQRVEDMNFTGAMIKGACKKARMWNMPLSEAVKYVTPLDMTEVNKLRGWAKGRCRSASYPGLYRGPAEEVLAENNSTSRRRMTKESIP